jgi:translocation and assembly module TamB
MTMIRSTSRTLALCIALSSPVAVPVIAVAQDNPLEMDNEEQKDWLTTLVQDRLSTPERQIRLSNIEGVLGSNVQIDEITIADDEGVWLRVNNAQLNWNQAALLLGRLEVETLAADSIEYLRNPNPSEAIDLPAPEAGTFQVPEFPVAVNIEEVTVPRVTFGEDVFGLGSEISLTGGLTLEDGNLDTSLDIVRLDGPGGTLDLDVAYTNETNVLDLSLALVEPENGVIANLLNIEGRPAVTLTLAGSGPVSDLETQLTLAANGQTALSGVATISQVAEGFQVDADVGGPLSTLVAEPYRPFFGPETALSVDALVRDEGGFSISNLQLSGGQLNLEAAAETTADNFLRTLALNASIAAPNGGPVTLPVPGASTQVESAQLVIAFGGETEEEWTSVLSVEDYQTDGFAADRVALNLGGVAANLSDPETRRLTFNGDGTISGITASQEVEAALGDSIDIGIAGLWNAGEPVQLAEFRVVGDALTAVLTGIVDGTDFHGDIALETSSIAPFSGLAGRDLDGSLSLAATGSLMPLTGGFSLTLDGTGTDLSIDDAVADDLLAGTVTLSGQIARTEAGFMADEFRIANQQVQITADGTFSSEEADFAFNLDLAELALLTDQATGALSVVGTAQSQGGEPLILRLDGTVPSGTLAGRSVRDATIGFDGALDGSNLGGTIDGSAMLEGRLAQLSADVSVTDEAQSLQNLDFAVAGTDFEGAFTRAADTGLIDGTLRVDASDISLAAALALQEVSGGVNAVVELGATGGRQDATVEGTLRDFSAEGISIGSADISASIADLFGVPMIDGSINGSDIAAAGVDIETLTATANQSGGSTSFDAQARLATGTDVDLAGTLTSIEDGYRLAIDRAQLAQGDLSARLAQPTVLEVAGSSVGLNGIRFNVGSGFITATGTAGENLDVSLDVNALPLSIANTIAPDLGLSGTLTGTAQISGSATDPEVGFQAQAAGVDAAAIGDLGIAPLTASASGSYADGTVRLASFSATGSGGLTLSGSGTVPLDGSGLDLSLTGSAPLAFANRFVAERGAQLSGTVTLDANVTGSLANPQFSGTVATSNAGYVDPELNLRLVGITGSASLNGDRLVINNLAASLASGGSVSASGSIGLTGGFPADIRIALNSARYADGNIFVATVTGGLSLTGNLTGTPLLSGDLFVEEGNITVPELFGGAAELIDVEHVNTPPAVERTLERARIDEAGAPVPQDRPRGLLLDVNLNAPNQVFIRGRGLDAEVGGSVRLTGPIGDIQPVGGLSLIRGRLDILGQRIVFDSGTVTLVGDLDPFINLVASTEGDDITVFITVSGRASDIDVTFTSDPALPQDEVLSRLIFNRSMGELSPLQLARLAGAAASLVGGGGGGLTDSLRGAAGLADLDIVTDDAGNVGVAAGTYIQDNIYLGVQAGAGGTSRVTINLDVTDDLTVKGAAAQNGESSVGVYYERDY